MHPDTWRPLEGVGLPRTRPIFLVDDGGQMTPWKVSQVAGEYLGSVGVDATCGWCRPCSDTRARPAPLCTLQFNPGHAVAAGAALAPASDG